MPVHRVKKGECLIGIACKHGFRNFREIYDAPENAGFRRRRPNPHVIKAGDELFIPEAPARTPFSCDTGKKYTFVVERPRAYVTLFIRSGTAPAANRKYVLHVADSALKGVTDGRGLVQQPVPGWVRDAVLEFPDDGLRFRVKLGELDPLSEPSGVRQRLQNLGFHCGDEDDDDPDAALADALRLFQSSRGITVSGKLDAKTLDRLREEHDHGVET